MYSLLYVKYTVISAEQIVTEVMLLTCVRNVAGSYISVTCCKSLREV